MVRKLGLHVGLYGLLLVAILASLPSGSSFGSDDGAFGAQVYALRQGDWALERPLPTVAQDNEGWLNSAITPSGPTPYTANPTYAAALTAVVRVVHGPTEVEEAAAGLTLGLRILPALGALGSAVVAWFLARRWNAEAAPLAFWLLALGPVLINSTTLWAHTLSTALAGLSLLAALAAIDAVNRSVWGRVLMAVGAVVSLSIAAVVRTEAVFWIVGLAIAMIVIDRSRATLVAVTLGTGVAGASWLANRAWGQYLRANRLPLETSIEALNGSPQWAASRFPAAWRLLMTSLGGGSGPVLTLGVIALVGAATIRLRRQRSSLPVSQAGDSTTNADAGYQARGSLVVSGLLVGAIALYGMRLAVAPGQVISGTIGAWPLAAILLAALTWNPHRTVPSSPKTHSPNQPAASPGDPVAAARTRRAAPLGAALLLPSGVLLVFVLATQYASSGGLQWGGRYLSSAFAPLAAAAAVGGLDLFRRHRLVLSGLMLAPAVVGIVASYQLHHLHHGVVESATSQASDVVITDTAPLPRLAWSALPTAFYRASPTDIEDLLIELGEAGVATVTVHGLVETDVDGLGGYRMTTTDAETIKAGVRQLVHGTISPTATPSPEALASNP